MSEDHERFGEWTAAYSLGALDYEDRRTFEQHLARCSLCAGQLAELAPIPALIAKIDADDLVPFADPALADAIGAAAGREVVLLQRRARWWRLAAAGSAAAALLVVALSLGGSEVSNAPPTQDVVLGQSLAETASISLRPKGWGTEVSLDITGLPARTGYQLWTVDGDGSWDSAATWSPTPTGNVHLIGASRVPTTGLERILITSEDRDDVLVEARP